MKPIHRLPSLELRDLRLVLAVARTGGLGAASRELHVTQSALSHQLRAVETRLGVEVFDRVGRRVVVNAHGERLVALADRLLPEVNDAERAITTPALPPRRLRVTTGCYTAYPWLPEALRRLGDAAPGTIVDVVVDATRRAAEALADGEVDVAVMPWHTPDARLLARPVFEEDIGVVMLPSDPLARRAHVPAAALAQRRVFTHELPPAELVWVRANLGRSFGALRHVERVPLTEAIVELTKGGEGVSLMGSWAIRRELQSGELVERPLRPRLRRPFAVVTARNRPEDPRADVLASVLIAWAGAAKIGKAARRPRRPVLFRTSCRDARRPSGGAHAARSHCFQRSRSSRVGAPRRPQPRPRRRASHPGFRCAPRWGCKEAPRCTSWGSPSTAFRWVAC